MYGKHFSSMYTGSMVGAGFGPYAVMGYVIGNQRPNRTAGYFSVDLNVKVMAAIFGEQEEYVQNAIDYLCSPDPLTTTPGEDGRRLIKIGSFTYKVVNGAHYDKIRNEEDRREQNRLNQERFRRKHQNKKLGESDNPSSSAYKSLENAACEADRNGDCKTFNQTSEIRIHPSKSDKL